MWSVVVCALLKLFDMIGRFQEPPEEFIMGDFLYGNPAPPDSPAFSPSDRVEGCHAFGEDVSKSFLEKNHLSHIICSSIVNEVRKKSIFIPYLAS